MSGRKTLLHMVTIPMSLTFLKGQVGFMKSHGFHVHALSSHGDELKEFSETEKVPVHEVLMTRRISPALDLIAILRILRIMRQVRPAIVHAHTPKAGLLGMIAAAISRVPVRIYQMRGLPCLTATGFRRKLLVISERTACRLSHLVICNSRSMRQAALDAGIADIHKLKVIKGGSGNGVDAQNRFNPTVVERGAREATRSSLGIPSPSIVIGFVGRIVKEKGILELADAWHLVRERYPSAYLLIVGPFDTRDPVPARVVADLQRDPRVRMTGMDWNTPPLYAAMDLVVLPSYREGFPNVPLEAAAMSLPVITTDVPGCIEAVENGVTGYIVPVKDSVALANAIETYLRQPELREIHGTAGRNRVLDMFRQQDIWEAVSIEYMTLLNKQAQNGELPKGSAPLKRFLDIVFSAGALILLLPLLAIVAAIVRIALGSPILFKQERPGLHGRPFTIYKFRTMRSAYDSAGNVLPDEFRMTRIGTILRQTSLDELPELWNVLRGEMSLVGPRPLLMEYLQRYTPEQNRRHEVKPGITGWAQVNGRNATTWRKRLALDIWYVDNRNLRLDLRIMLLTLKKVVGRQDIHQQGHVTMPLFIEEPEKSEERVRP